MSSIKQVVSIWTVLLVSVTLLGGVDGQIRMENRILNRRYGSRIEPSRQSVWLSSPVAPQMHQQQPKYLDISLDLLGQHSSHLLFPHPLSISDNQKFPNEFASNSQPPLLAPYHSPLQPAKHPIPYAARDNGRYPSPMQAAAASTYHTATAKKPYPYQSQRPLYISYPTYGVHYQQQSVNYDPIMNQHQHHSNNNHLSAASSSSSHYSLNNPLGLSSCCNGNQWKPLSFTHSPPTSTSQIPQVISDPMHTSKQQMSLYLPVQMYDVVAESQRVSKVISSPSKTPPTTLYIPVPKENNTIIGSQDNNTNINETAHDNPSPESDMSFGTTVGLFDSVALTSTQSTMEVATVKPNDDTTDIAAAAIIKPTASTKSPTTPKPRPTTAKDVEKATTTAKPKPKPKPPANDQPAAESPEVADDVPSRPSLQRPSRPISPVDDSEFQDGPLEDPTFEGVPGDLPAFEDVPVDSPAAEGGESPLPGLFSEFLNQVADMIEEFQPTTELPFADDAQGLADGSVADDFAGASDTAQDSLLSGSAADGNFESPGGGQDGGDFGAGGEPFDNFDSGPGANDNFDSGPGANDNFAGGQPESLPMANNPVSTSIQQGTIAGTPPVGEQSAQSLSNTVSVTADYAGQNLTADNAHATDDNKDKPTSNPTLPTAAAQTSVSSGQYPAPVPANAANYDPAPIASQPQIHPPATDYGDPGIYNSFPSFPVPQIGATLSSNNVVGSNDRPQRQEMFPNRVHDHNPQYGNEFPHSDDIEPLVEATTIFEHFARPDEYPPRIDHVQPYDPIAHDNEFSNQMVTNNDSMIDYDAYSNDTHIEERPTLPVSNHLGTPNLQPWNEPTSTTAYPHSDGQSFLLTSTTEIPFHTDDTTVQPMNASYPNPNTKVDVISPQYQAENHLGADVTSTQTPMDVEQQQPAETLNSPPPLAFATQTTTAPDTTIREYASSDKTINEFSNHVDDHHPEDPQPASIEYTEGDVHEAEGIPPDILPEVQANINLDLLKTANLAQD